MDSDTVNETITHLFGDDPVTDPNPSSSQYSEHEYEEDLEEGMEEAEEDLEEGMEEAEEDVEEGMEDAAEAVEEGMEETEEEVEDQDEELFVIEEQVVDEEFLNEGPKTKMQFRSEENLIAAYQSHAKHKGFSVAIRRRTPLYLMITCHRGRKAEATKSSQMIGCLARINAIKNQKQGIWVVSSVNHVHNHELDPMNSVFMAAHKTLTVNMNRHLENNDIAGLRPSKSIRLLQVQAGGPQNLGVDKKDCRNFIEQRRRLRLGAGDAEAIHNLFLRLQKTNRNFFHLMDIDDNGRLRNLMWIHPRSVAAYEEFHEVVSFDTTYLVNKYDMPFATVVGINHHNQSILLGCALLSKEDSESFKWFWSKWLAGMGNIAPTAILTNQCDGIKNALKEVMPETIHRLCIWHILSKVPTKFKVVADSKEAGREFTELIYESITIDELESRWDEFVEKHNLHGNRWLSDLWDVRESWIPVYLNHIFWAGCKSTQRSESMHSFFDNYIHSRSSLKQFVEQYEIAVCDKVYNEMRADYDSKTRVIKCFSSFKWEEQFQKVYTNNIFQLVQDEIKEMWACDISNVPGIGEDVEKFEVVDSGILSKYRKQHTYTVEYRPNGGYLDCDCKMFNSRGILCRHIFKALVKKNIDSVNERYIMRRWRKDVYRRHSSICFAGGYSHMTNEYSRYQDVEKVFQECTDKSYQDENKMKFIKETLKECSAKLDTMSSTVVDLEGEGEEAVRNHVLDPVQINRRGRPKKNRNKSIVEQVSEKQKRKTTKETNKKKNNNKKKIS